NVPSLFVDVGHGCLYRSVRVNIHDRDTDGKLLPHSFLSEIGRAHRVTHRGIHRVTCSAQGECCFKTDSGACSCDEYCCHCAILLCSAQRAEVYTSCLETQVLNPC